MMNIKENFKIFLRTLGIFSILSIPSLLIFFTGEKLELENAPKKILFVTLYLLILFIFSMLLPVKKKPNFGRKILKDIFNSIKIFFVLISISAALFIIESSLFTYAKPLLFIEAIVAAAFSRPYSLMSYTYYELMVSPFGNIEKWEVPQIHQDNQDILSFFAPIVYWLIIIFCAIRIRQWIDLLLANRNAVHKN